MLLFIMIDFYFNIIYYYLFKNGTFIIIKSFNLN